MKLLHGAQYVAHVLNDVDSPHLSEGGVAKGPGKPIEIAEHVRAAGRIAVDADRARILVYAATDIEDFQLRGRALRHASSVSMANSAWSRVITSGGHRRMLFGPAPSTSRPRSKAMFSSWSRISGARSLVAGSRTISIPIIRPSPRTSPTQRNRCGQSRI